MWSRSCVPRRPLEAIREEAIRKRLGLGATLLPPKGVCLRGSLCSPACMSAVRTGGMRAFRVLGPAATVDGVTGAAGRVPTGESERILPELAITSRFFPPGDPASQTRSNRAGGRDGC